MVEPALNMEVEKARSFLEKYSAVTLMAAGKFPASPMPSMIRAANEVVNAGDGYGRGQCTGSANHVGGIFNAEGHFCGKSAEGVHTSTDRPYGNGP